MEIYKDHLDVKMTATELVLTVLRIAKTQAVEMAFEELKATIAKIKSEYKD